MPLSEELLNPVPGPNPSGRNLRYAVYDKVREARREEDGTPQGDWSYERKTADFPLALRLCRDALTQTKDLQLAVWATEAAFKTLGLRGLREGLDLLRGLTETFWDTIYPELEDGDAEGRAGPLEFLGGRFTEHLLYLPINAEGHNWLQYKQSRAVGYEADASSSDEKTRNRELAISEGKLAPEVFDKAVSKTPKAFYEEIVVETDACLTALEQLNATCETKFGEARPSFARLRESLEDLRQTLVILLRKKKDEEPSPPQKKDEEPSPPQKVEDRDIGHERSEEPVAAPVAADQTESFPTIPAASKEPADIADAIERVVLAAHFWRKDQPYNPVPYLLLRALRWGELRGDQDSLDVLQLEAPSTEVRKQLRALAQNSEWEELLEASERAMASPCGRAWLDLQKYVLRACNALGESYALVHRAILSELKALLTDYPQLKESLLNDETPAANPETHTWLAGLVKPAEQIPTRHQPPAKEASEPETVDSFDLAKQSADAGRPYEAIAIMEREAAKERSGRSRFQRKLQLAQICITAGHARIALPILEALAREIDDRNLEGWEDPELVIQTLGLLYNCLEKLKRNPELKEEVYARICRLGPAQALELVK